MLELAKKILGDYDKGIVQYENYEFRTFPKQEIIDLVTSNNWRNKIVQINSEITYSGKVLDANKLASSQVSIVNPLEYSVKFYGSEEVSITNLSLLGYIQMMAIMNYHPFADGNKRTGLIAGLTLIEEIYGDKIFTSVREEDQEFLAKSIIWYFESGKARESELEFMYNSIVNYYLLG